MVPIWFQNLIPIWFQKTMLRYQNLEPFWYQKLEPKPARENKFWRKGAYTNHCTLNWFCHRIATSCGACCDGTTPQRNRPRAASIAARAARAKHECRVGSTFYHHHILLAVSTCGEVAITLKTRRLPRRTCARCVRVCMCVCVCVAFRMRSRAVANALT